eukprot:Gb_28261 [translate_table: standard]
MTDCQAHGIKIVWPPASSVYVDPPISNHHRSRSTEKIQLVWSYQASHAENVDYGVIASELVAAWIEKMQLIVVWLETNGEGATVEMSEKSKTNLFHGQEIHPRREREIEEVKRRKGKEVAEERVTPSTAQQQSQLL